MLDCIPVAGYYCGCPYLFVIGRVEFTPVAIREGMALSENLFRGGSTKVDYDFIPTSVFSLPNIGTVGFSEAEAQSKYGEIKVFESRFKPMKQTLGLKGTEPFWPVGVFDAGPISLAALTVHESCTRPSRSITALCV
ncbi:MAG: hypothetical protein AB9Q20_11225 [Candidatus Reddybacter sp.]